MTKNDMAKPNRKISKVLIANRGEISSRIQRACREYGVPSLVIASEVDALLPFAKNADELEILPGNTAQETYLDMDLLLSIAAKHSCNAIHPGYGFLSENSEFAKKVEDAGLIFIGPSVRSIEIMGDKLSAKEVAISAGVPLSPSLPILSDTINPDQIVEAVGLPILLKAAAGGGGRGMRIVRDKKDLPEEIERAQSEALKFFSDKRIFAERFIEQPRHVEVQVFGDEHGEVVHFGTRDCSVQRRHQKLVEEAPAPFLSSSVRETLHESAVKLAKAVDYAGAGTVEFLVKGEEIFFLEMNTRIQVEHPVTEEAYGVDLVKLQLEVADGKPLLKKYKKLTPKKHSFEFRIYAESPADEFKPDLGTISEISSPKSLLRSKTYLREDSGFCAGSKISPFYDAMLMKIIVTGETREDALIKSRYVLREYSIKGIDTTLPFHLWLLYCTPFSESLVDISFIEREFLGEEDLNQIAPLLRVDKDHSSYGARYGKVEILNAFDSNKKIERTVELIHRPDGLFLARFQGEKDPLKAKISNSKQRALKELL